MPIIFDEVIVQVEQPQPQPAAGPAQGGAQRAQPPTDLVKQLREIEIRARRLSAD